MIKLITTLQSFSKTFYRQILLIEYVSNNTYCVLGEGMDAIIKDISNKGKYLKIDFSNFNFPYLFATIKFHKNPIKFRFVTCNTNCYNKQACKIFFNYLNKILCEISKNDKCKIINNNHQVLKESK